MKIDNLYLTELTQDEVKEVNGGSITAAIAVAAACVGIFMAGYEIGKDIYAITHTGD